MSDIKYNIKKERFTIMNVGEVSKKDALDFILKMKELYSDYPVFSRSIKSFYNEFSVHKFLYICHILRKKTKDAGMQYPLSKFIEFLYSIFGPISRLFIQ